MIDNLLWHQVNVNRPTPGKSANGAVTNTYAAAYTNLACQVQPVKAQWLLMYQQRKIEISHSVYFGSNPTVKNGDQIVFGSRTFLVQGIRDLTEQGKVKVVDCLELT